MKKDGIKVEKYEGTWYVIDESERDGKMLYLLEHEQYGDEVPGMIVDEQLNVIVEEVWNGWLDYEEEMEWREMERDYSPSSTNGDYSPGNPWDAPGMSIHDFI